MSSSVPFSPASSKVLYVCRVGGEAGVDVAHVDHDVYLAGERHTVVRAGVVARLTGPRLRLVGTQQLPTDERSFVGHVFRTPELNLNALHTRPLP